MPRWTLCLPGRPPLGHPVPTPLTLPASTTRLTFRPFTVTDGGRILRLVGDPEVMRYLQGGALAAERVEAEVLAPMLRTAAELPGYGRICVEHRRAGAFIGWVSLVPRVPDAGPMYGWARGGGGATVVELGYRVVRDAWGSGLATEAARAASDYALTSLGARTVVATTMAANTGSRRVLERVGFTLMGIRLLQWDEPNPGWEQGEAEYVLGDRPG